MLTTALITILCLGLMIGVEICVSIFINPILLLIEDPASRARATSLFAARLGHAMPFWYAASLLCLVGEAFLHRQTPFAFHLLLAAAVLWAAIIVYTLVALVPINNRIAALDPQAPTPNWASEHHTWNVLHAIRVVLLLAAFLLALYALLT